MKNRQKDDDNNLVKSVEELRRERSIQRLRSYDSGAQYSHHSHSSNKSSKHHRISSERHIRRRSSESEGSTSLTKSPVSSAPHHRVIHLADPLHVHVQGLDPVLDQSPVVEQRRRYSTKRRIRLLARFHHHGVVVESQEERRHHLMRRDDAIIIHICNWQKRSQLHRLIGKEVGKYWCRLAHIVWKIDIRTSRTRRIDQLHLIDLTNLLEVSGHHGV